MKILKSFVLNVLSLMSLVAQNDTLYQQLETKKGYFLMHHNMSLHLYEKNTKNASISLDNIS